MNSEQYDEGPFIHGMAESTECPQGYSELAFGSLSHYVVAKGIPQKLQVLGFIASDKSMVFTSMTPVSPRGDGFLQPITLSMIDNDLDAVLFADQDYVLRAAKLPKAGNEPQDSYLLFLCTLSKPLFDACYSMLTYPHFSLMLRRA
jgi:hypothetical protein